MIRTLITDEQRAQLLANGRAHAAGQPVDPLPVVRLFTPDAHATWLLTEVDPQDGDTAFGLCDLGLGMPRARHAGAEHGAPLRIGLDPWAAELARRARFVFHRATAVVRVRSTRTGEWFGHGLIAPDDHADGSIYLARSSYISHPSRSEFRPLPHQSPSRPIVVRRRPKWYQSLADTPASSTVRANPGAVRRLRLSAMMQWFGADRS
jgi:hypothetical protein